MDDRNRHVYSIKNFNLLLREFREKLFVYSGRQDWID